MTPIARIACWTLGATLMAVSTAQAISIRGSDQFTLADNPTGISADWTGGYSQDVGFGLTASNNFQVVSGAIQSIANSNDSVQAYTALSAAVDQGASIVLSSISATDSYPGVMVRVTSATDLTAISCRILMPLSSNTRIERWSAGVFSELALTSGVSWESGDTLSCEAEGSAIRMYRTRAGLKELVLSATDASPVSGRAGLINFSNPTLAATVLDNYTQYDFTLKPSVTQSTTCYGDADAAAVCAFTNPPAVGSTIVLLISSQQAPYVNGCSQTKSFSDPHGTNLYDLAVEGPVQGTSQSSIWFRTITQTVSGSWSISLQCVSAGGTRELTVTALEIDGALPVYAAFESPGWAGATNPTTVTVTSFASTSQNNTLGVAVLSMSVPEVTITPNGAWTAYHNNGDSASHAVGSAVAINYIAVTVPSHAWGISYVTSTGNDAAQAVIAVFRASQSGATAISRTLQWLDNATNETHFRVEKRTDQTYPNWIVEADGLGANTQSYIATIMQSESNDCWRVFAVNVNGERVSNEACGGTISIPPPPPPPPPPPVIQIGGMQPLMDDEML